MSQFAIMWFLFFFPGCWFKSFACAAPQCHVVNTDSNAVRDRQSCDFEDQLNEVQMDRFLNWREQSLLLSQQMTNYSVSDGEDPSGSSEEDEDDEFMCVHQNLNVVICEFVLKDSFNQKWKFAWTFSLTHWSSAVMCAMHVLISSQTHIKFLFPQN